MKKILIWTIIGIIWVYFLSISNVNAYELSKEKTEVIEKSLDVKTINSLNTLLSKWDSKKTYDVYNKLSIVVYNLQMKVISNNSLSEIKKSELIDKYNSVLYIIEKHLDDKYMPYNLEWDSI